jgi:hypothetical protein
MLPSQLCAETAFIVEGIVVEEGKSSGVPVVNGKKPPMLRRARADNVKKLNLTLRFRLTR